MITYEPPNGELPAYFATPEGDGPWPGVVIAHDAFGLTSDIRRIADRVAGAATSPSSRRCTAGAIGWRASYAR